MKVFADPGKSLLHFVIIIYVGVGVENVLIISLHIPITLLVNKKSTQWNSLKNIIYLFFDILKALWFKELFAYFICFDAVLIILTKYKSALSCSCKSGNWGLYWALHWNI